VAIDVRSRAIVNQWPIAAAEGSAGIDIDTAHHRMFVGCHNQRMLMLDTGNGHVLASVPIEAGVDANAFDSSTHNIYLATAERVPAPTAPSGPSAAAAGPSRVRPAIVPGSFRILVCGNVREVSP